MNRQRKLRLYQAAIDAVHYSQEQEPSAYQVSYDWTYRDDVHAEWRRVRAEQRRYFGLEFSLREDEVYYVVDICEDGDGDTTVWARVEIRGEDGRPQTVERTTRVDPLAIELFIEEARKLLSRAQAKYGIPVMHESTVSAS